MKYEIPCPKCNTKFDVSKQMQNWKEELFSEIEKIMKKMASSNLNKANDRNDREVKKE